MHSPDCKCQHCHWMEEIAKWIKEVSEVLKQIKAIMQGNPDPPHHVKTHRKKKRRRNWKNQ